MGLGAFANAQARQVAMKGEAPPQDLPVAGDEALDMGGARLEHGSAVGGDGEKAEAQESTELLHARVVLPRCSEQTHAACEAA